MARRCPLRLHFKRRDTRRCTLLPGSFRIFPREVSKSRSNQQSVSLAERVTDVFAAPRGMTRRAFLAILAAGVPAYRAQDVGGMASRGVRPQPCAKCSGLAFHARFTDIAARVWLRAPVIYGLR